MKRLRNKVQKFFYYLAEDTTRLPARAFNLLMMLLIFVSMIVWLLDTNKEVSKLWGRELQTIEFVCMILFLIEYTFRLLAYEGPFWKFVIKPMSLIDALAIAPFFFSGSTNTAALRLLRLFRVFRIFKLARYSEAINRLIRVFQLNSSALGVFLFVIVVILFISAALMHTLEPERFAQMTDALWWSIVTLTTVGYGDIVPETVVGRFVAAVLMIFGIGIIALPTGVLGASMTHLLTQEKNTTDTECTRCGERKHLSEARYCSRCGERLPS
ncbi:MAG: ion transporter [Leptospiraceae bacterium]|nr:ion transporter [Leptospiraceae bacterium]